MSRKCDYEYYKITAVENAFALLKLFSSSVTQMRLSDLSRQLGRPKSSVYRLLKTMEMDGIVRFNQITGTYSPGLRLVEMGATALGALDIRKQARPLMERLSRDTGLTVHLGVLDVSEVVYVDKIEGKDTVPLYSRVGRRLPVHCSALGKALMAGLPDDTVTHILSRVTLKRYTQKTITDPRRLLEEICATRQRGYAVDFGEHEPSVTCIGTEIRHTSSEQRAAVSLTFVGSRRNTNLKELAGLLMDASRQISRHL